MNHKFPYKYRIRPLPHKIETPGWPNSYQNDGKERTATRYSDLTSVPAFFDPQHQGYIYISDTIPARKPTIVIVQEK